jgi:hypothetical protein
MKGVDEAGMIAFDLECSKGHVFEGWFNNAHSFEEQQTGGLVSCPYCNDTEVKKIMSPVTTKTATRRELAERQEGIDYRRLAREIVDYVNKNFDDVGPNFTKEALKMHYGVSEKRSIKGSATAEEEETLQKEGIPYFQFPIPKIDDEEKN